VEEFVPTVSVDATPDDGSPWLPYIFIFPFGLSLPGGPIEFVFTGVRSIGSSEAEGESEGVAECECMGRGLL